MPRQAFLSTVYGPRPHYGGEKRGAHMIKACGITRVEDAAAAARLGFDAVGMVFTPSPRRVDPDRARAISSSLPLRLLRVGVFVDEEVREVRRIMDHCFLDLAQLHGDESPREAARLGSRVIKAMRLRGPEELALLEEYPGVFAILLDAWDPDLRGGTGRTSDWDLAARAAAKTRVILAGGLNPGNVEEAIRRTRPFGVDTASGVESAPGRKDHILLAEFARRAREAFAAVSEEGAHARG